MIPLLNSLPFCFSFYSSDLSAFFPSFDLYNSLVDQLIMYTCPSLSLAFYDSFLNQLIMYFLFILQLMIIFYLNYEPFLLPFSSFSL